jgi:hypothetical protein
MMPKMFWSVGIKTPFIVPNLEPSPCLKENELCSADSLSSKTSTRENKRECGARDMVHFALSDEHKNKHIIECIHVSGTTCNNISTTCSLQRLQVVPVLPSVCSPLHDTPLFSFISIAIILLSGSVCVGILWSNDVPFACIQCKNSDWKERSSLQKKTKKQKRPFGTCITFRTTKVQTIFVAVLLRVFVFMHAP